MIRGLERLSAMRYPGRGIILGRARNGGLQVVAYFITGRSAASQARKLAWENQTLWTRSSNEETLKKGQVELLIYPAVMITEIGLAVSNGKQTEDLARALRPGVTPGKALSEGLKSWNYEPDAPIFTPRISGCLLQDGRLGLHLIKRRPDGSEERRSFSFSPLKKGRGVLLTTYAGPDRKTPPSFEGAPLPVRLTLSTSARQAAEAVYAALGPARGKKDYRVAAACLFIDPASGRVAEVGIINRSEGIEANHG